MTFRQAGFVPDMTEIVYNPENQLYPWFSQ